MSVKLQKQIFEECPPPSDEDWNFLSDLPKGGPLCRIFPRLDRVQATAMERKAHAAAQRRKMSVQCKYDSGARLLRVWRAR